jgi:hypothetical protein
MPWQRTPEEAANVIEMLEAEPKDRRPDLVCHNDQSRGAEDDAAYRPEPEPPSPDDFLSKRSADEPKMYPDGAQKPRKAKVMFFFAENGANARARSANELGTSAPLPMPVIPRAKSKRTTLFANPQTKGQMAI